MVSTPTLLVTILLFFTIFGTMVVYAMGYKKVAPSKAMVLFRGTPEGNPKAVGVIQSGGRFMVPGARNFKIIDMVADMVEFELTGVPTAAIGSPVTLRLKVAAIWKIDSEPEVLRNRAGKLVERTHGENEMAVREQLEQAIRNTSGSISPQAFEADMELVRTKAAKEANDAISDLGLLVLTIRFLDVKPQG